MTEEMYNRGNRRREYMCKTIMRRMQSAEENAEGSAEESAEESVVHKKTEQLKESTALFFLCIFLLIETCSVILYISVVHHY